jgi:phage baseplate assembly protein W
MAIKIQNLENVASQFTTKQYLYKDLALDLKLTKILAGGYSSPLPGPDIRVSYDLAAITNSLVNLFNTLPGQRFLFPEYGLDLYRYLFEPITKYNAESLGEKIYRSIRLYEPRVDPQQIRVQSDPDNNLYNITVVIRLPELNTTAETNFILDIKNQQFITVPTSRNL